jgi:hypothetical protein
VHGSGGVEAAAPQPRTTAQVHGVGKRRGRRRWRRRGGVGVSGAAGTRRGSGAAAESDRSGAQCGQTVRTTTRCRGGGRVAHGEVVEGRLRAD